MSLVYVQDTELTTVGETIRKFTGTDTKYTPSEMCAGIKDAIANYAVKKTVTGTSIAVNDAAKFRPVEMKLYGKSTQATTKGNQLLDLPDVSESELNGVKLSCINGAVTIKGTATNTVNSSGKGIKYNIPIIAGTYYISGNYVYVAVKKSDGTFKYYCKTSFALDGTEESALVYINITTGTTVNETIYPMVNLGTTALAFEPYTGGIASPNPDYPQEVIPLGASGSIECGVLGKNKSPIQLFKKGFLPDSGTEITTHSSYPNAKYGPKFSVKQGDVIYVKAKGLSNAEGNLRLRYLVDDKTYQSYLVVSGNPSDDGYIYTSGTITKANAVAMQCMDITGNLSEIIIQVNEPITKDTVDDYQSLTLQTPEGLHGIPLGTTIPSVIANSPIHMRGVYWDNATSRYYIADTKNDNGKNVQRIYEYGVEDFLEVAVAGDSKWYDSEKSYSYEMKNMKVNSPLGNLGTGIMEKSTHFMGYSFNQFYNKAVENGCLTGQPYIVVNISKSLGICKTVDEFRQYCIDNNVKFYKVLKTPIETDLTTEEIAQYKALHMNCPNTTILNDANAEMELTYVVEPK